MPLNQQVEAVNPHTRLLQSKAMDDVFLPLIEILGAATLGFAVLIGIIWGISKVFGRGPQPRKHHRHGRHHHEEPY